MEPVAAREVCEHALRHTKGPLDGWWFEEHWSKGSVEVRKLRTAHPEFRGEVPLTKHEPMPEILERSREWIIDGTFPGAARIKAGGEIPTVILLRDAVGELFVMDGQCRVLTALWHGIERLDAYIYQESGVRRLPQDNGGVSP